MVSEDHTANEAARIVGAAIGKPDLKWVIFSDEDMQRALERRMPPHIAASMVEMGAAIHSGVLGEHYYSVSSTVVKGKVKLEDFARDEFAPAFFK